MQLWLHYFRHLSSVNKEELDQLRNKNIAAILKSRDSYGIHREKEKEKKSLNCRVWRTAVSYPYTSSNTDCGCVCISLYVCTPNTEPSSLKNITAKTVACFILNKKDELTDFPLWLISSV